MLRNLFLIVPFLLLVHVTSALALPPCPGSDDPNTWTNCRGTYSHSDEVRYVGEFRDGRFHGLGTLHWDNNFRYGTWEMGMLIEGVSQTTEYRYEGEFKDNIYSGHGTMEWFLDGTIYVGEFRDGLPNGFGTKTWPNKNNYVGEFLNAKRHGTGTLTFFDGTKYIGEFKDGYIHGNGTIYYPDGRGFVGEFAASKPVSGNYFSKKSHSNAKGNDGAAWMALGAILRAWSGVDSPAYNAAPSFRGPSPMNQLSCSNQGGKLFCNDSTGLQSSCRTQGGQLFCGGSDGSQFSCYQQGGKYFCN